MKSIRLGLVGAAALAVGLSAQTPQQQPAQEQPQSQQQRQQQQQATEGKMVTLTGCVYQATDQPTVFALQRTADQSTASTSKPGATGTTGTGAEGRDMARTDTAGSDTGAWYRLSSSATQDLKEHVGHAVRVTGTMMPGRDEKGADVVIHRIQPDKLTVTAIDLKPAPELKIESITSASGECRQGETKQ